MRTLWTRKGIIGNQGLTIIQKDQKLGLSQENSQDSKGDAIWTRKGPELNRLSRAIAVMVRGYIKQLSLLL